MSLFVSDDEDYLDEPMGSLVQDENHEASPMENGKEASPMESLAARNVPDNNSNRLEANPVINTTIPTEPPNATLNLHSETRRGSLNEIPVVFRDDARPIITPHALCSSLVLQFHREIAETLLSKDGLLVMGHGMGHDQVIANVLHALSFRVGNKSPLVMVLNAREDELVALNEVLTELLWMEEMESERKREGEQKSGNEHGSEQGRQNDDKQKDSDMQKDSGLQNDKDMQNDTDINDTEAGFANFCLKTGDMTTPAKRRRMYASGGLLAVPARTLSVDLLAGVVSPAAITGLVILHAERVKETLAEALVVSLYRDGNAWGFVKAILDSPEAFTGFTPLALRLKVLRLLNVFLWPRFHVAVTLLLQKHKGQKKSQTLHVTEINVRLTRRMAQIQGAVLACIEACLGELRRHNPSLDTEYWNVDNVHDEGFSQRVRRLLEPHWHRLLWTLKQLVHDVATLADLLAALLVDDSVAFYQRVQSLVEGASGKSASPWLMMDEAPAIVTYARERALGDSEVRRRNLHRNERNQTTSADESPAATEFLPPRSSPMLEELPKWAQLSAVIEDIAHERSLSHTEGAILVMCASGRTAQQLSHLLSSAKRGKGQYLFRPYMASRLREYVLWKLLTAKTAALAAEFAEPEVEQVQVSKTFARTGPVSKRRRTRGDAAVARVELLRGGKIQAAPDVDPETLRAVEQEVKEESENQEETENMEETENSEETETLPAGPTSIFVSDDSDEEQSYPGRFNSFSHISLSAQIVIAAYSDREELLQEISPAYIIMYEPDLSFIRRVEIFQALSRPAKVFFMYYGTSVEEQRHLVRIRKEKQAFTKLIKEKATLGKHFASDADNWKFRIKKTQVANTRIAGGATFRTENDEMRVIVDTREFRSSLPNLLYRVGIQVVPCMLTVGDYVLSPKLCVERKAIPDLISSFKSGRLYQQCEQMFRHYESPVLLIEFDENKSFSLEPFAEFKPPTSRATNPLSAKILKQEIQLKITELLVSFPRLKILWSSSPYESAQIFLELKASQHEPDVEEALSKGVNPSITTSDGPPMINDDVVDILQSIPGINTVNYVRIIQKVSNMAELVCLSREKFVELLGEENGNKAYNFINHEVS